MEETQSCMEVMKVRVQAELLPGCLLWGAQWTVCVYKGLCVCVSQEVTNRKEVPIGSQREIEIE